MAHNVRGPILFPKCFIKHLSDSWVSSIDGVKSVWWYLRAIRWGILGSLRLLTQILDFYPAMELTLYSVSKDSTCTWMWICVQICMQGKLYREWSFVLRRQTLLGQRCGHGGKYNLTVRVFLLECNLEL